ncbi:MAG TPA: hypothetical protein VMX97_17025 [Hyphomicrobiaceae bacterium]|nr:hypothetical protein [Hyphomicrobiaceae bacterium]
MAIQLTRRQFSRGALAVAGARGVPSVSLPGTVVPTGADDAYEVLLTEYIRTEETAFHATGGLATGQGGALTWQGRQLESFLSNLDMRMDVTSSAGKVVGEFRDFVRKQLASADQSTRVVGTECPAQHVPQVIEDADPEPPAQSTEISGKSENAEAESDRQPPVRPA